MKKPLITSLNRVHVGARGSNLSKAQVKEVFEEIKKHYPELQFITTWITTTGDKDLATPLSSLEKTDFFTKEIDQLLLQGTIDIAIHSAKDLPDPLPKGLCIIAITEGLDPSDSFVLRENETLQSLPLGALIGTSSKRRENGIKSLREDLQCVNIRGTIEKRLELLDKSQVDGLIVAECALIRLNLEKRNRIRMPGETAPLQGQLAVIAREGEEILQQMFSKISK